MKSHTGSVTATGSKTTQLASEITGCGQPYVWGHGLLGSMAQDRDGGVLAWEDLTDVAQLIRYDARGHGQSGSEGEPEDFRWDNLARNMWEVADSATDDAVVLGGASMGCATALHAACQRPENVKGLVLVIPPTAWEWREPRRNGYRITANIVKYTRALPFRLMGLLRIKLDDKDFRKSTLGAMAQHLAKVKPEGVVGAMRGAALSDFPSREELAALDVPTLIIAWPDDRTHPLEVAQELFRVIPGAELEITDHTTRPYACAARERAFMASLD
jgi:3-oxoadipate enol-lactonase